MKYFVVSDVHGFFTELISALSDAGFDDTNPDHKLVICGDLMDRGQEAEKLQDYIQLLLEENKVILIRGNHEDLVIEMLDDLNNDDFCCRNDIMYSHHASNGTLNTICQLTGLEVWDAIYTPDYFAIKGRNTPFVKKIIPKMVNYFETENYIFVHGWIPCTTQGVDKIPRSHNEGRTLEYDKNWREAKYGDWEIARWRNGMECCRKGILEPNKTIVCGHWNASYGHAVIEGKGSQFGDDADHSIYEANGIIAIDACTSYSGKVNCIIVED